MPKHANLRQFPYPPIDTILTSNGRKSHHVCHHHRLEDKVKQLTKPTTPSLIIGAISDLSRSKTDLMVENAILRQQVIVLNRQVKRPKFTLGDRFRLVFLSRLTDFWHTALHVIQPETLLRWHRTFFRLYWKRKTKSRERKPRIPQEKIDLIIQMAIENPRWGAKMICGELLKLDICVHKRTLQRHIRKVRKRNSGQNWATFLRSHAQNIWACDFTVVHTLYFKPLYIFVIIHQKTRRIVHAAVTASPTDEWTAQEMREATPWGQRPKYLIRDNDGKYGHKFKTVLECSGIKDINTPVRAPRANAICERFIGTLKLGCLDHYLILHERQLRRVVGEFSRTTTIHDRIRELITWFPTVSINLVLHCQTNPEDQLSLSRFFVGFTAAIHTQQQSINSLIQ